MLTFTRTFISTTGLLVSLSIVGCSADATDAPASGSNALGDTPSAPSAAASIFEPDSCEGRDLTKSEIAALLDVHLKHTLATSFELKFRERRRNSETNSFSDWKPVEAFLFDNETVAGWRSAVTSGPIRLSASSSTLTILMLTLPTNAINAWPVAMFVENSPMQWTWPAPLSERANFVINRENNAREHVGELEVETTEARITDKCVWLRGTTLERGSQTLQFALRARRQ